MSLFRRNIPVAVLIPLTMLWFGIDETQKTMFIFIATVPFVFFEAARAMSGVHDRYVETAQTLGASQRQVVTKVLIPLAMPRHLSRACAASSVSRSATSCSPSW